MVMMDGNKGREEHPPMRPCHSEGHTEACYNEQGSAIITCGADHSVRVFASYEDEDAKAIEDQHADSAVTALAVKGHKLVTGAEDHTVRLFNLKTLEFDGFLTRFQSPVRALAFSNTGSLVAAAGDEMVIKLFAFSDKSCRELRGHDGTVRSLSFDPDGDLLASASDDGTVRIWNIKSGECVNELPVLSSVRGSSDNVCKVSWHPNAKCIAVPEKASVHVYDRNAEFMFAFDVDGHQKPVCIAQWSPNGEYLASVSIEGEILIWETKTKESVSRFCHPHRMRITSLAWNPDPAKSELTWTDALGRFSVWRNPVPDSAHFAKPSVATTAEAGGNKATLDALFESDDEDFGKHKRKAKAKKPADEDKGQGAGAHQHNQHSSSGAAASKPYGGAAAQATASSASAAAPSESGIEMSIEPTAADDSESEDEGPTQYAPAPERYVQGPFQPASTPVDNARRFLCYNTVGTITSREEDTTNAVDVEFHNTALHRPVRLVDHFGFTMGTLTETAFALAAPAHFPTNMDPRDHPSVLFCRNIEHWASDDSWQIFFPDGEEVEVVAMGGGEAGYVAAATSKRYIRIYSSNGIARHILSLEGPVVSMSAKDEQLFVVYHAAQGTGEDQQLAYLLLDIDTRKLVAKGPLPISPNSQLAWLGFSDDGLPATADTEEVVRVLTTEWGFSWSPIIELKMNKGDKNKKDFHWIIGLTDAELLCIMCRGGDNFPRMLPKPLMSTVKLQMPVVSFSDASKLEDSFLRAKINLEHTIRVEELDELDPKDRKLIQNAQRQMDQYIIGCISKAVQSQKPGRALDLTTFLSLSSSIDIAIKLAVKAKLPMLAERMSIAKAAHEAAEADRIRGLRRAVMPAAAASTTKGNFANFSPVLTAYPSPPADSPQHHREVPSSAPRPSLQQRQAAGGRPVAVVATRSAGSDSGEEDGSEAADEPRAVPARGEAADNGDSAGEEDGSEAPSKAPRVLTLGSRPPASGAKREDVSSSSTLAPQKKVNPFAKKASEQPKLQKIERSTSFADAITGAGAGAVSPQKRKPTLPTLSEGGKGASKAAPSASKAANSNKLGPQAGAKSNAAGPKPTKPITAYLAWLSKNRAGIKAENPGLGSAELVKFAGAKWAALSDDEKRPYVADYEKAKEDYEVALAKHEGRAVKPQAPAAKKKKTSEEDEGTPSAKHGEDAVDDGEETRKTRGAEEEGDSEQAQQLSGDEDEGTIASAEESKINSKGEDRDHEDEAPIEENESTTRRKTAPTAMSLDAFAFGK